MRPVILQLDESLERQPELRRAVDARGGQVLDLSDLGPSLRLWARRSDLHQLERRLDACPPPAEGAEVVFAGSGDFHHVTALLLRRTLARVREPVTVIHFDNHPDWARLVRGRHCGSWVCHAARLAGVARFITVGLCGPEFSAIRAREGDLELVEDDCVDLLAWSAPDGRPELTICGRSWPTITGLGEEAAIAWLDRTVPTRAVYITIDKDVLRPEDAVTNWNPGQASLGFLMAAIERLGRGRRLVGADVVGDWSEPVYGGGGAAAILKRGEALLDQPWGRRRTAEADRLNESVNLRLLDLMSDLAA